MNNDKIIELYDRLENKVIGLGLDPKFKENPAYERIIDNVASHISRMGVFNYQGEATLRLVTEGKNQIKIEFTNPGTKEKNTMFITCKDPNTLECIKITEKPVTYSKENKPLKSSYTYGMTATLNPNNGEIYINNSNAYVDNYECNDNRHNLGFNGESIWYDKNGIMYRREYRSGPRQFNLRDSLNAFDQTSLIAKIDLCKNLFNKDDYETRTVIMRDKLDTAKIHDEDRRRGTEYNAIVPLNRETGLQDMKLIGGDPYPKNIVIPALGTEQVDAMITNERNRIVQEGLKRYAQGRENYSYRSEDDKGFIRSGFNDEMNL